MAVSESPHSPQVDLGSLDFWGRPADERDRYFAELRRDAPISRHQPPEDILDLPDQERMGYWAIGSLTRHEPRGTRSSPAVGGEIVRELDMARTFPR